MLFIFGVEISVNCAWCLFDSKLFLILGLDRKVLNFEEAVFVVHQL